MKKFTKMLALGLAAALVLGMSVQAAPSTTTAGMDKVEGVEFTPATEAEVDAVKDIVKKEAGEKANIVGAFEMSVTDKVGEVTVRVDSVSRGDSVYVYKYEDASCTKLIAKIAVSPEAGSFTFKPMEGCFYVVVNMGKAAAPSGSSSSGSSASQNPATAPKTGETVPAAGIMALVLMAGAAVCAKKVRYNR